MKVLVLGGTGHLGSNLVRALLARGDEVRVLVRPIRSSRQAVGHLMLRGLDVERVDGDLNDAKSLIRACEGVRVVYQAASYYPSQTIPVEAATRQALAETDNLLRAVHRASVERLVFTSTLTTIGFPAQPGRLADEDCAFTTAYPNNPYLMAKIAMENAVLAAAKDGVPAVVINPTAFFGPFDSKPTSGTQILMIAKRMMLGYVDGPVNAIDVRDVAEGMILAAARGRVGERYILGNWNTTQKELNALIARVAGVRPPLVPVPFALARVGAKVGDAVFRTIFRRPALVPGFFVEVLAHMQQYDCSKAIRELGYPRRPVEHAIRDALAWFRANGYLPA
ncbi:MAG TPA: NAD-dependent epimerase/dehydratase family protein [Nitrospiraceae bacterium]|jgi:dihydroflavonol-4-reductase|nr:NAD-dependent epimerase/dehydratase family protein [Nitrospiraceae bacterium]